MDNINCPKKDLKTEANICRSSHIASFDTAFTYLSTVISRLLPATQPSSGRYGHKRQVNSSSRGVGVGRGGRFEGREGRGRGGKEGRRGRGRRNIKQSKMFGGM